VLELVEAFERMSGSKVPRVVVPRRAGDAAVSYADVHRVRDWLAWEAQNDIDAICRDTWRWQNKNEFGYL